MFRIQVYEKPAAMPIVVAGPPATDSKHVVASVTPYLSVDIIGKHFTSRLWEQEPMRWIEEEVHRRRGGGNTATQREYWLVSFASFRPKWAKVWRHEVTLLAEQGRRPMKIEEIAELLGKDWNINSTINPPNRR